MNILSCAAMAVLLATAEMDNAAEKIAGEIARAAASLSNRTVAVDVFTDEEGNECAEGRAVSDRIIAALVRGGAVTVIEREKLRRVVEEQELGASGMVEEADDGIGHLIGANAIVHGVVTILDGGVDVSARMVDAEKGTVIGAWVESEKEETLQNEADRASVETGAEIRRNREALATMRRAKPEEYQEIARRRAAFRANLREKNLLDYHRALEARGRLRRIARERPLLLLAAVQGRRSRAARQIAKEGTPQQKEAVRKIVAQAALVRAYFPDEIPKLVKTAEERLEKADRKDDRRTQPRRPGSRRR